MTAPHVVPEENESVVAGLAKMSPERLLVLFAGVAAIAFGGLSLVLSLMGEPYPRAIVGYTLLGGAIFGFVIALAFGLALLLAFAQMGVKPAEGSILALAFSVVLLAFGALPGLIAGILGLVGALTGIVRHLSFSKP